MLPGPMYLKYREILMRTEKVFFFSKNQFFRHDVTKWRHNDEMFTYLKSTHLGLQFEVLLDIVDRRFKNDLQEGQLRP